MLGRFATLTTVTRPKLFVTYHRTSMFGEARTIITSLYSEQNHRELVILLLYPDPVARAPISLDLPLQHRIQYVKLSSVPPESYYGVKT
jgi:hypothetical protein